VIHATGVRLLESHGSTDTTKWEWLILQALYVFLNTANQSHIAYDRALQCWKLQYILYMWLLFEYIPDCYIRVYGFLLSFQDGQGYTWYFCKSFSDSNFCVVPCHSFCFTIVLVSLLRSLNFPERFPAFCFIIVVGWLLLSRWQGRIQDGLGALEPPPKTRDTLNSHSIKAACSKLFKEFYLLY